jgi:putative membrane protein insertion efficiency factor
MGPLSESPRPHGMGPLSESPRRQAPGLVAFLIRAYRVVMAPAIGRVCRFEPSCSHYAEEAITRWGIFRGIWLTVRRLARCQPFSRGGWDPVPENQREVLPCRPALSAAAAQQGR